jgi:hypothetical protein
VSDIRVDDSGTPWQACPSCGLERIPSANGIRAHDEFCNGALQRYMTILGDRGLQPFHREPWRNPYTGRIEPRVLGDQPPMRWRVSPDEWHRLEAWARAQWSPWIEDLPATLFGWPIQADPALRPSSIVFEAVSA